MLQQRARLTINVGNLLELFGAGCGVYGVDRLVGLAWALVAAGVLLVVAAEFIYDGRLVSIPLPHRPQLGHRIARLRDRARARRLLHGRRWMTWRPRRPSLWW